MSKEKSKEQLLIELLKSKGEVTLKARYGKTQGPFITCPVIDPTTGQIRGTKPMSDEDRKKAIRVVDSTTTRKIIDGTSFKASNPVDVIDWSWLVYNKEIALSRAEAWKDEIILFFVDDVEREIEERLSKKELILTASFEVQSLSADAKVQICRLLGISVTHMSPKEISSFLYDKAENMPQKILSMINDKDAEAKILVFDLIEAKVIQKDEETGVYLYGTSKIGTKINSVISWINDPENAQIVTEMRKDMLPI